MAKKKIYRASNNFPLLVTLLVMVFVIPLTVFAVTFQSFFLGVVAKSEESAPSTKVTKSFLGTVAKTTVDKKTNYVLTTGENKEYLLRTTATGPSSFASYVGKTVLISGWFNLSGDTLYVVSLTPAAK